MSDLGFDVRGYCERLAKACPDRYRFIMDNLSPGQWSLVNANYSRESFFHSHWLACNARLWQGELWKFFGPLAQEHKIRLELDGDRPWLESIIAAVVESFESEVKG